MRLPSAALQYPRLALDWLAELGGRRVLLYGAYTFVLFVVFLFVNFPYDDLVQRRLQNLDLGKIQLDVEQIHLGLLGFSCGNLKLAQAGDADGTPPLLEASTMFVGPSWSSWMRGQFKAARVHGAMYQGTVDADLAYSDDAALATIDLQSVDLARYRLLSRNLDEGQVVGRLSGTVSFELHPANLAAGQAVGELEVKSGGLVGAKVKGVAIPDLHFSQLTTKFSLKGDRFDVQDLRADGDEIKLSGNGQIVIRDPLPDSVLNLRVTLQPGAQNPDLVKVVMALLQRPPNSRADAPISITGTLAQPRAR